MRAFSELVLVGRVVKPQGRRGEVAVEPFSDRSDRFPKLARAFVAGPQCEPRELTVEGCFPHKGRFVLKLAGFDSIEAAEALRGAELRIEESELGSCPRARTTTTSSPGSPSRTSRAAPWAGSSR